MPDTEPLRENPEADSDVGSELPTYDPELGSRIKQLIEAVGGMDAAARIARASDQTLRRYSEMSGGIKLEPLYRLAVAANASFDWLLRGDGPMREAERFQGRNAALSGIRRWADQQGGVVGLPTGAGKTDLASVWFRRLDTVNDRDLEQLGASPSQTYAVLRYLPAGARMGGTSPQSGSTAAPPVILSDDYIRRTFNLGPSDVTVVQAAGDGMRPTIEDGDLVLVDVTKPLLKGDGVYAIRWGEVIQVKRLEVHLDGRITVISDNERYPPKEIPAHGAIGFDVIGRVIWRGRPF